METILIPGAEIYYDKNFLSPEEATTLFNLLRTKCAWERRKSSFKWEEPGDHPDNIQATHWWCNEERGSIRTGE
jgi:hypothetical protein